MERNEVVEDCMFEVVDKAVDMAENRGDDTIEDKAGNTADLYLAMAVE